jgi:hypothetical protein
MLDAFLLVFCVWQAFVLFVGLICANCVKVGETRIDGSLNCRVYRRHPINSLVGKWQAWIMWMAMEGERELEMPVAGNFGVRVRSSVEQDFLHTPGDDQIIHLSRDMKCNISGVTNGTNVLERPAYEIDTGDRPAIMPGVITYKHLTKCCDPLFLHILILWRFYWKNMFVAFRQCTRELCIVFHIKTFRVGIGLCHCHGYTVRLLALENVRIGVRAIIAATEPVEEGSGSSGSQQNEQEGCDCGQDGPFASPMTIWYQERSCAAKRFSNSVQGQWTGERVPQG